MRTIALLPLVLLAGLLTSGCSAELDSSSRRVIIPEHTPETLAAMVRSRDLAGIQAALAAGVDPNMPNRSSLPPLHMAAALGLIEEAQLLLEQGAEIDKVCVVSTPRADGQVNWQPMTTPLHLAAQGGHVDFVLMLLDQNANVNLQNAHDATPLDMTRVVAGRLKLKVETISESIEKVSQPSHSEPLTDMLKRTESQLRGVETIARLLEHRGAKTLRDLQVAQFLSEIDADGTLHDVPLRIKQWQSGRKPRGERFFASDESLGELPLEGVEPTPATTSDADTPDAP